ncbi:Non-specific serine/threonine protein kinase [Sulfidibacter corallicola]|uniref:Protein kinase n=1 Tax=Sulfidibacter corallicola TaxID=2818388 RepID=A0A8A4TUI8_SULCO|nr:serine/threonine protein kinase [Sulfidibacter corallicola]QTD53619.1 protein kinase [Sulfidibacter corallicola]
MTQQKIGRYIIEAVQGEGAMGKVYRAFDPVIQRTVAIKKVSFKGIEKENDREKYKENFFREARIAGSLHHPNIVTIHDIGEDQGEPFVVMEYIDGEVLADRLELGEPLTYAACARIISQISYALSVAHERQIVHRDIKPQNIMLDRDESVRILDFGIAKLADAHGGQPGEFLGTPKYASPEQIRNQALDHRSDLFSLGVLAHNLLTGASPFPGSSLDSILYKILNCPPDIQSLPATLGVNDSRFRAIFEKVLFKHPDRRYQSAVQFANDLEDVLKDVDLSSTVRSGRMSPEQEAKVNEFKDQFEKAVAEERLDDARTAVEGLRGEEQDVHEEEKVLAKLSSIVESKREAERQQQVERFRKAFREHIKRGDLEQAEQSIGKLQELSVTVKKERTTLERELDRQAKIAPVRGEYEQAIAASDVDRATGLLADLEAMDAASDDNRGALVALKTRVERELIERDRRVSEYRGLFKEAIANRDVEKAEQQLAGMGELGQNHQDERKALDNLIRIIAEESKARESQADILRALFQEEVARGDLKAAENTLKELRILDEHVGNEIRALNLARRGTSDGDPEIDRSIAEQQTLFRRALEARDVGAAQNALNQLNQLGEDIASLQGELQQLQVESAATERKESGGINKLTLVAGILVVVLVAAGIGMFMSGDGGDTDPKVSPPAQQVQTTPTEPASGTASIDTEGSSTQTPSVQTEDTPGDTQGEGTPGEEGVPGELDPALAASGDLPLNPEQSTEEPDSAEPDPPVVEQAPVQVAAAEKPAEVRPRPKQPPKPKPKGGGSPAAEQPPPDEFSIPDTEFRNYLVREFDRNGNGALSLDEAKSVREINTPGTNSERGNIKNLTGIEHFSSLERLTVAYEQIELVPPLPDGLEVLVLSHNHLSALPPLSTKLRDLDLSHNRLSDDDCAQIAALIWENLDKRGIFIEFNPQEGNKTLKCVRLALESLPPLVELVRIPNEKLSNGERKFVQVEEIIGEKDFDKAQKQLRKLARSDKDTYRYREVFAMYHYSHAEYLKTQNAMRKDIFAQYQTVVDGLAARDRLTEKGAYYLGLCYYALDQKKKAFQTWRDIDKTRFPGLDAYYREADAYLRN